MILAFQISIVLLVVAFFSLSIAFFLLRRHMIERVSQLERQHDKTWADCRSTTNALARINAKVLNLSKAEEAHDKERRHDSNLLSKEIAAVAEDVTTLAEDFRKLDEKVSDAYEVVETQAKKEKLMFDGLTSIMDYDVNMARKAVSGDAE